MDKIYLNIFLLFKQFLLSLLELCEASGVDWLIFQRNIDRQIPK